MKNETGSFIRWKSLVRMVLTVCIAITALCLSYTSPADAARNRENLAAFPGAEGAAKFTPGGRGGDVYHVINTNSSGDGSLAHGIKTADGPRTIVFDIGGTIHFDEELNILEKKRLTIAGQTAPGDGVTLRFDQGGLRISNCEDIIITHLRIANGSVDNRFDILRTDGSENVLLSHLSLRWGTRSNLVSRSNGPLTAQYLINAEPTDRQLAGWFGQMRLHEGLYNQTIRKNLGIHQSGRFNMFQGGRFEFINNVTYNADLRWHNTFYIFSRPEYGTRETDLGAQLADVNAIGNVLIDGHNPPASSFAFGKASRVFIDGNVRDWDPNVPFSPENADEDIFEGIPGYMVGHSLMIELRADKFARVDIPLDLRLNDLQRTKPVSARQAYIDVLSRSGSSLTRDKHDHRYIRDVMNKTTRKLPESVADVPGDPFPQLDHGKPVQSSARDGIADAWKKERGLDPEVAYHQKYTREGYTYLEKYLHWLMRYSLPPETLETREIVVESTYQQGGFASVSSFGFQENNDPSGYNSFTVSKADEILQFGLLRFDISMVEPGMLNDASLELTLRDKDGSGHFRVYGLDHDRERQVWPDGHITADMAPAFIETGNAIEMNRDDVILLGDLKLEDGVASLTNPNLAVFLNLAMYYREYPESELVTLVFKPLEEGKVEFFADDNEGNGFAPRLKLNAIPR